MWWITICCFVAAAALLVRALRAHRPYTDNVPTDVLAALVRDYWRHVPATLTHECLLRRTITTTSSSLVQALQAAQCFTSCSQRLTGACAYSCSRRAHFAPKMSRTLRSPPVGHGYKVQVGIQRLQASPLPSLRLHYSVKPRCKRIRQHVQRGTGAILRHHSMASMVTLLDSPRAFLQWNQYEQHVPHFCFQAGSSRLRSDAASAAAR
jgi:hypothetical protein